MGMDMGLNLSTISPDSQSSNVSHFEGLSVGQPLFSDPRSFTPEAFDAPQSSTEKEPKSSMSMGSMSTADMFKAISDLEQPKRPLPGTRHYGSDTAMYTLLQNVF